MNQKQLLPIDDQYQLARLLHLHGPDAATWKKLCAILLAIATSQPNNAKYVAYRANLLLLHKEVPDAEALIAQLEQLEKDRKLPAGAMGSIEPKVRRARAARQGAAGRRADDRLRQSEGRPAVAHAAAGRTAWPAGKLPEAVDLCYQVKLKGYREEAYASALSILRAGKPTAKDAAKLPRWQQQVARMEEYLRLGIEADAENLTLRLQLGDLMDMQGRFDQVEDDLPRHLQEGRRQSRGPQQPGVAARRQGRQGPGSTRAGAAGDPAPRRPARAARHARRGLSRPGQGARGDPGPRTGRPRRTDAHPLFPSVAGPAFGKERSARPRRLACANELGLNAQVLDANDQEFYRQFEKDL